MSPLEWALAAGFWPAVPIAGYWLLAITGLRRGLQAGIASVGLVSAVGITLWSPVLLISLVAGVYSPLAIGLIGWALVIGFVAGRLLTGSVVPPGGRTGGDRSPLGGWDIVLGAGLLLAAFLYLGFPGEFVIGGRDENSYALHGLWIAEHRRLDIPYPWPPALHATFYDAFLRFSGTFRTEPTMTPAFGHVLPTWLAQAASTFGFEGLSRVNGIFSLLSVTVFYGVCRLMVTKPFAVVAALVFALNPGQIWVSRTTLTEVLTQLLLWAALWLLVVALQSGIRSSARWAGAILGVAVLVRVDSVIVLPLLFLAHLVTRLAEDDRQRSSPIWRALYATALPSIVVAIAYYLAFSRPYLVELTPQLNQVAVATLVAMAILAIGTRPGLRRPLHALATSRASLILVGSLLATATVYAYFVRPNHEPFATFAAEQVLLGGKRTYAEDALPNLAAYLSAPVVFAGVGGWFVAVWLAARERASALVPLILVGGGISLLYLTNPTVTPDHFWAVRRFLPAVMPAFIAFAAFAAWWLVARLRRVTAAACVGALVLFAAFSAQGMAPFLFLSEHNGYRSQLATLAGHLPADDIVMALNGERWWKPLYVLFGRRVVDLSLGSASGREAFTTWVSRELAEGRQPLVLTVERQIFIPGLQYEPVHTEFLRRRQHRGSPTPLPTEVVDEATEINVFRVIGADEAYPYRDINLVAGLVWGATRTGFHDRELLGDTAVTWTDGSARLTVPTRLAPRELRIGIAASAVDNGSFRVVANGVELFNGSLPAGEWEATFELASVPHRASLTVELISDARSVARDIPVDGSLYRRQIVERSEGIAIRSLQLSGTLDEP
jgi:Dolichyl-phosphate-mannose-protein mannosyltransferase